MNETKAGYSDSEVRERHERDLPRWQFDDGCITRKYRTEGWKGALMVANTVAHLAEAAWHHPDLVVTYGGVRYGCAVTTQTESRRGISNLPAASRTSFTGNPPGKAGHSRGRRWTIRGSATSSTTDAQAAGSVPPHRGTSGQRSEPARKCGGNACITPRQKNWRRSPRRSLDTWPADPPRGQCRRWKKTSPRHRVSSPTSAKPVP